MQDSTGNIRTHIYEGQLGFSSSPSLSYLKLLGLKLNIALFCFNYRELKPELPQSFPFVLFNFVFTFIYLPVVLGTEPRASWL